MTVVTFVRVEVRMQQFQILRTLRDITDKIKILFTEFKYLFGFQDIWSQSWQKRSYFVSALKIPERINSSLDAGLIW